MEPVVMNNFQNNTGESIRDARPPSYSCSPVLSITYTRRQNKGAEDLTFHRGLFSPRRLQKFPTARDFIEQDRAGHGDVERFYGRPLRYARSQLDRAGG
jgi:hypothetical protein